jgi:prevent-host-death family protein
MRVLGVEDAQFSRVRLCIQETAAPPIWRLVRFSKRRTRSLRRSQYHFSITAMRTELVTTLKRQATDILADLARDRAPILITQHGLPGAYLVDVQTYEQQQQRIAILEGIARGEMAVAEGRVLSHAKAKARMARWLK